MENLSLSLAVVPIVVNAGAAVLPMILGGLASALALLLRPRELLAACRRYPLRMAGVLATLVLLGSAGYLWARRSPRLVPSPPDFWDQVARERLRAGQTPGLPTTARVSGGPLQLGVDATRCSWDGGPAPLALSDTPAWFKDSESLVLSSPVVRGDRVYYGTALMDIAGQFGSLVCRDLATGKEIWRMDNHPDGKPLQPFFSSPALTADGKYLVIGQGLHEHRDCYLLCVDAATGALRWRVATPLHIESSPVIYKHPRLGDVAVVGCGAIEGPDRQPIGHKGMVISVQLETGNLLWRYMLADPESSPAMCNGNVIIGSGFNGQAVVALEPTGPQPREVWRYATPYPVTGPITVADGIVFAGCGNSDLVTNDPRPRGAVIAIHADSGKRLWQYDTPDAVLGGLAVRGQLLLVPCKSGEVLALHPYIGKVLWRTAISKRNAVLAGLALTSSAAYAVSKDGCLAVLDIRPVLPPDAPRVRQRIYINDKARPGDQGLCISTPLVAGGRILVGSETGGLRCIVGSSLAK